MLKFAYYDLPKPDKSVYYICVYNVQCRSFVKWNMGSFFDIHFEDNRGNDEYQTDRVVTSDAQWPLSQITRGSHVCFQVKI